MTDFQGWRVGLAAAVGSVLVMTTARTQPAVSLPGDDRSAWTATHHAPDAPSLSWTEGAEGAVTFGEGGLSVMQRDWTIGTAPFEMCVDLRIDTGRLAPWREAGVTISASSAPVSEMTEDDWAVILAVAEQGVIATVRTRSARWGEEIRPGVWNLTGKDIAPRYQLTMAGGGGHHDSVPWPTDVIDGTRLRLHAMRGPDHTMQLTVYHADAPGGPWWEARCELPEALRDRPLRYLTIHTTREAAQFRNPAEVVSPPKMPTGVIESVRAQALASGVPQWREPMPAPTIVRDPAPGPRQSIFASPEQLRELRDKFNDPAFEHYRAVLLRNASDERVQPLDGERPPSPNDITSLLWAYLLTGDSAYREPLLAQVDAVTGPTEVLPARRWGWPGHRRQWLDVKQFNAHRYEALAQVYDTLYDELSPERREAIERALLRSLAHFHREIERRSWWYYNNPSNVVGVGSGAHGIIALALRFDHADLAERTIDTAVRTIKERYIAVRPDGGCVEGNMYWNYGMSYPMLFGYALRRVTGDDRGLLTGDELRHAYRYLETNLGGDGKLVPFNDTQPWLNGWLICAHAGSEFDQPLMRWMADHMAETFATTEPIFKEQDRGAFALSAFLYRDREPAPEQFPGVPTLSTLESVQEGVMRSRGDVLVPALVTAVKGKGEVTTHHANEDQGSFVLYARGEMLLLDPGYFDGGATEHSLPLVGDPAEVKLHAAAVCPLVEAWEAGPVRSITVDSTAAYDHPKAPASQKVERVRRTFVQVGDEAVIVLDDVRPRDPQAPVTAQLQCGFEPSVVGDGVAVVHGERGELAVHTFPAVAWEVEPREFRQKTWVCARLGVTWRTLRGPVATAPGEPLVTVLLPGEDAAGLPAPEVRRTAGHVIVRLPSGKQVRFERSGADGPWSATRP